jgi:hemoglobin-like flavoprotein
MTNQEIALVQNTFSKVIPIAETAATLFYNKLFELDPSTQALFARADMNKQKKVLMDTLKTVVYSLNDFETVRSSVEALGKRHVRYKVEERHYTVVGQALIWALSQGLGNDFTADVKAAWISAYTFLANTMKDAARKTAVSI